MRTIPSFWAIVLQSNTSVLFAPCHVSVTRATNGSFRHPTCTQRAADRPSHLHPYHALVVSGIQRATDGSFMHPTCTQRGQESGQWALSPAPWYVCTHVTSQWLLASRSDWQVLYAPNLHPESSWWALSPPCKMHPRCDHFPCTQNVAPQRLPAPQRATDGLFTHQTCFQRVADRPSRPFKMRPCDHFPCTQMLCPSNYPQIVAYGLTDGLIL